MCELVNTVWLTWTWGPGTWPPLAGQELELLEEVQVSPQSSTPPEPGLLAPPLSVWTPEQPVCETLVRNSAPSGCVAG